MAKTERDRVDASLKRAIELLRENFGEADQQAAVSLAAFLHATRERDEFLSEHPQEPGAAYP